MHLILMRRWAMVLMLKKLIPVLTLRLDLERKGNSILPSQLRQK
jgi:hypothetical protein